MHRAFFMLPDILLPPSVGQIAGDAIAAWEPGILRPAHMMDGEIPDIVRIPARTFTRAISLATVMWSRILTYSASEHRAR